MLCTLNYLFEIQNNLMHSTHTSCLEIWVNWCQNECFWKSITCALYLLNYKSILNWKCFWIFFGCFLEVKEQANFMCIDINWDTKLSIEMKLFYDKHTKKEMYHSHIFLRWLKSVHFNMPVARITFLSKLWYLQYKSKQNVPQFWKKRDSCNWLP